MGCTMIPHYPERREQPSDSPEALPVLKSA
jgi:hypothetical protein